MNIIPNANREAMDEFEELLNREHNMTKDEYIQWKATRGEDAGDWDHKLCETADACVKAATMNNYYAWLDTNDVPEPLRQYLKDNATYSYRYAEFNDLLIAMKCYPEWI